jgi:nucleoside-diphosphate-sugar epimerase
VEGLYRLFHDGDSEPTNIGNPEEYTVAELAQIVLDLTGSRSAIDYRPLPADDPRQRRPDISRARAMLGWEPKVAVRDGVARTIEYFRSLNTDRMAPRGARPRSFAGSNA